MHGAGVHSLSPTNSKVCRQAISLFIFSKTKEEILSFHHVQIHRYSRIKASAFLQSLEIPDLARSFCYFLDWLQRLQDYKIEIRGHMRSREGESDWVYA